MIKVLPLNNKKDKLEAAEGVRLGGFHLKQMCFRRKCRAFIVLNVLQQRGEPLVAFGQSSDTIEIVDPGFKNNDNGEEVTRFEVRKGFLVNRVAFH